uniref:Uncharacterized protein n=1 Tax=Plectus sambesii TaxID=2011161 RepID=A0A914XGU5_9BILA
MKSILIVCITLSLIGLVTAGSFLDVDDHICCVELHSRREKLEDEIGRLLEKIDDENDEIDRLAHKLDKFLTDQHNYWTDLKHFMTKTKPKAGERGPPGRKGPIGPKGATGERGLPGVNAYKSSTF